MELQQEYLIPQEVKSEIYFGKGIYFFDAAFIVMFWFVLSNFETLVYEPIRIGYTVFNIVIPLILTRKSKDNPGRRRYQSLIFTFLADKQTIYHGRERGQKSIELTE